MQIIKRLVIAIVLGLAAGAVAMFVSVIILTIANLYLSGHSYTWHEQEVWPGTRWIDLPFMLTTFGAFFGVGGIYWYLSGKKPQDDSVQD